VIKEMFLAAFFPFIQPGGSQDHISLWGSSHTLFCGPHCPNLDQTIKQSLWLKLPAETKLQEMAESVPSKRSVWTVRWISDKDVVKTGSGKTKTKSKTVALKTKTKTLAVMTKTKMLALLVNIDCHHWLVAWHSGRTWSLAGVLFLSCARHV